MSWGELRDSPICVGPKQSSDATPKVVMTKKQIGERTGQLGGLSISFRLAMLGGMAQGSNRQVNPRCQEALRAAFASTRRSVACRPLRAPNGTPLGFDFELCA